MKSVIFDLDGTLADTSADLIAAANACFEGMGHGPLLDAKADALTAFHGGRAMLRLGFSRLDAHWDEAMVDAHWRPFLGYYADHISVHTTLYPNVVPALEELQRRGYLLGICTNKPEGLAEELMRRLGVRDAFAALVGADTLAVRKPDPEPLFEAARRAGGDPALTCLVGDSDTDRNTAKAAGVPSILVTFGPSGEDMAALTPEALIDPCANCTVTEDGLTPSPS